ncbi:MAG: DUF4412 domain-containing protein [Acidobacteriia bacterium]|nr:DUF4412 domain-containing protein [Terriglobia bacterium]
MNIGRNYLGFLVTALASLALAGGSHAQQAPFESPLPPPPPGSHASYGEIAPGAEPGMLEDTIVFIGFEEGLGGKMVTGAPFSATYSTQTTQVLADGNKIERSNSGTFARDGQGRTRREMSLPAIGPWAASRQTAPHVVFINDAVAGTQYILETDRKIARKMQRPPRRMRRGGALGYAPLPPSASMPAPNKRNDVTTTSLGSQTINGVLAEGTRTTRTIPAGAIGNANPIVITHERWYSPDLQTVMMTKRSDPRTGETVFQLTDIQRQEPDASLFQVPSDYTVKQGGNRIFQRRLAPPSPDASPTQPPSQD